MSCGLYALSPSMTVYGSCRSAVYAHLDSGRIMEETFYPYSKFEIRKVHILVWIRSNSFLDKQVDSWIFMSRKFGLQDTVSG